MHKFIGSVLITLVMYIALVLMLYIMQRELIYIPSQVRPLPENFGLETFDAQIVEIDSEQEISLYSWWVEPAKPNKSTILYFSGNAGHIGYRSQKVIHYIQQGYGLLMVSYRYNAGIGGDPSEKNIMTDAQAAYDYLMSNNIPKENIIIYGESLGTGVAAKLAATNETGALILEAPYTSLYELAYTHYPMVPFPKLLVKDKFDTDSIISQIKSPIFIMHGTNDRVIPYHHSEKLVKKIKTNYILYPLENYGHSGLYSNSGIEKEVLLFLESYGL